MKSAMKFKIAVSISHRQRLYRTFVTKEKKSRYEIVKKRKNLFHFSYISWGEKKEKKFLSAKIRNPMMRDTRHFSFVE